MVVAVNDVAEGRLNINIDRNNITKDEIGDLTNSVIKMVDTILNLVNEMQTLYTSFEKGDIDARMDKNKFSGSYQDVVTNVNELAHSLIADILSALAILAELGNGNFNVVIKPMPGKKAQIPETIQGFVNTLRSINSDIADLVKFAGDGDLQHRADTGKYRGDWLNLIIGLNELMKTIVAPIDESKYVLGEIAAGNFGNKMQGHYKGEFLVMKNAVNETITNVATYINEISTVLSALADDDLNQDITRDYVGKFSDIKVALLNIIYKFNNVISSITSASGQVASGAKMLSDSSMHLASGATEQASSIEELNATMLTINENTKQNAESAKEADKLSDELRQNAEKGNNDMSQMLISMDGIKTSSDMISKIIKVIEDISFQTNLLALNAAVEAARAGEHGKGFSVVADEVRTLAGKTSESAKETSKLIEEAINRVNDGTAVANKTGEALKIIVKEAEMVSDIITNIAKASDEQAIAVSHVMEGIHQITNVVQSNSATAEESASASQELTSQADVLKEMTGVFKLKRK
jgi:methyl-accepting chemotaxis protein